MENDQELIKEVYPITILRESQQNKDEGECWISEDVIKKWTDIPKKWQEEVKKKLVEDGYILNEDGTVTKAEEV